MIKRFKNLLSPPPPKPKKVIFESSVIRHIKSLPNKLIWPDDTPMMAQTIIVHCSEPVDYRKFIEGTMQATSKLSESDDFQVMFSKMDGKIEVR